MAILCQTCGTEFLTWTGKCPHCGGTMPIEIKPKADPMLGKVVGGRYKVSKKLGQGGMGSVYLAEHLGVGQRVAIKFLNPSFSTDRNVLQRFLNEAKSYGQITHPHAVQLHDFGQDEEGNLYISMEFIEGQDLKRLLDSQPGGRLHLRDALDIVLQVCDVLGYAHEKGIVHRDLKPENVMLVKSLRGWHAKVLDFGVARLMAEQTRVTAAGSICGTPRYMAPEQAEGGEVDHRVDVYALGLVLYECVTGTHPFIASTIAETLRRQVLEPMPHLSAAAPDLKLPDALDAAIQKATAKDRAQRWASMTDFAKALVPLMPTSQLDAGLVQEGLQRAQTALKAEPVRIPEKTSHGGSPYDREGSRSRAGMLVGMGLVAAAALAVGGYFAVRPPAGGPVIEDPLPPPPRPTEPSIEVPPPIDNPEPTPSPVKPAGPTAATPGPADPGRVSGASTPRPRPRPAPVPAPHADPQGTPASADPRVVDTAAAELRKQADLTLLSLAKNDFAAGALEQALTRLGGIGADSAVKADAQALRSEVTRTKDLLERAGAAYQAGNCEEAIRLYRQVQEASPNIRAAADGITRCRKQMPAGVID